MPKILIFESEEMLRDMYRTKFEMEGFEVADYKTPGTNPVSIVLKEKPDIISMDIIMPETDGFIATKQIKHDKRTKNIPLYFLTNLGQQDDLQKGLSLGADEYLIKAKHLPAEVVNIAKKLILISSQPKRSWWQKLFG